MSATLRHSGWHSEVCVDPTEMALHRVESTMRVYMQQERILDGFRQRLHSESKNRGTTDRRDFAFVVALDCALMTIGDREEWSP